MRVLLVGADKELPGGIEGVLAANNWNVDHVSDLTAATRIVDDYGTDAVILGGQHQSSGEADRFLRFVDSRRIAALVVGDRFGDCSAIDPGSLIDVAGGEVTKEELTRRLGMLARFRSHLQGVEREVERMHQLGERLNQHFRDIGDELRLASRLQRDFLPRNVETIGPVRFATVYRPASWVSGDIFDIQRLDEKHVGFYLADAVGHGMSSGLLTIFIKRSMETKIVSGDGHQIVEPDEVLRNLNNALVTQRLPNCQFVTGVYCLLDIETLVLRYARGGHPYPVLIRRDGRLTDMKSTGGLMGLFPELECDTGEVQLQPGDKVLLYTDGLEAAFDDLSQPHGAPGNGYRALIDSIAGCGASEIVVRLNEALDRQDGSLNPEDDVSVVVMEVSAEP